MSQAPTSSTATETPDLPKSDLNLVWIDCEMTGLDPENERLLEIAVIVTAPDLTQRVEGPVLVIHQSDELLGKMDAWNKGTHGKSGLIDKVKASTTSEADAQEQILTFLKKYLPNHDAVHGNRWLRPFRNSLLHPRLWHLNRHSAAGAVAAGLFCGLIPGPLGARTEVPPYATIQISRSSRRSRAMSVSRARGPLSRRWMSPIRCWSG